MRVLTLLGNIFRNIERCAPRAVAGDIEALHQMRVGVRRLRVLLRALRRPLRDTSEKEIERGWDDLSGRLGGSRDADVWSQFLGSQQVRDSLTDDPSSELLLQAQGERQARLKHETQVLLSDPAYLALVQGTRSLLEGAAPRVIRATPEARIHRHLRRALSRALRRMVSRRRQARTTDPQAMHRLRIACRRARYLAEFTSELSGPRAARRLQRLARRLRAVQTPLGDIHDRDVQLAFLAGASLPVPPSLVDRLKGLRCQALSEFQRRWRLVKREVRRR